MQDIQSTKQIQTYDFPSFCQEVQQAFNEGYIFDFQTNDNYPSTFGTVYSAILVQPTESLPEGLEGSTVGFASGGVLPAQKQKELLGEAPSESLAKTVGRPKKV
jgi:hypothetical protein